MRIRPALASLAVLALGTGGVAAVAPAPAALAAKAGGQVTSVDDCLESVPDPGTVIPVEICYTLVRPAGADARHPVPMVLHSHGWGGSRTTDPAAFQAFTDAGYAVLSFDQRGFGESGGHAYVENPTVEGHDVRALVDLVADLDWVEQDGPGDPRLAAIGGSYGGGYQFLAAFEEQRRGRPVFDALAPEITWNDLADSLAPQGVVRTAWAAALTAGGAPTDALPKRIYKALAEGVATGQFPDGSVPGTENLYDFFEKNGPKWQVPRAGRLDIPVLFGQGTTDSLFPLAQGLANWRTALTPAARARSIFVGYNGGHVLPAVFPRGVSVTSDPCSQQLAGGDFRTLTIRFFDEVLRGERTGLTGFGQYHLATPGSTCLTVDSVTPQTPVAVGTVVSTEGAGAPLPVKVADGPITIAGSPVLTGKATALGVDNRAFYGLAVGTSELDAQLVQDNVMPLRLLDPVNGVRVRVALPSVAVEVPEGQSLYLVAAPFSDTFVTMGTRTPGAVVLQDARVRLPVVTPAAQRG